MAVNLLIYPIDYPPTIVGPSDLDLRIIELEAKMESTSILSLQDRRDAGNDAIDLELKNTTVSVFHSAIPRFGFRDLNQGTTGYLLGGESQDSLTGRITKFDYLFEAASLLGADLGIARHSGAGTSAVAAGYIGGGNTAANITAKIEKLAFDAETVSLLAAQLPGAASEMVGFATTSESFYLGGFAGAGNTIVTEIRTLKHGTETTALLSAQLATPRSNAAIVGNTVHGFVVGGKTAIGSTTYSQSVEKMTWLTQAVAPAGFSLGAAGVAFAVGVGNDFSGYIIGGRSGAANSTSIQRVAHTTESISTLGIALAAPRSDATAVGSSRLGYLMSGGVDPTGEFRSTGTTASVERLTFVGANAPTERIEALSFSLAYGVCGASGVSDYSPGTYSSSSISIVNLYDGIYSKLGHIHDDIYPRIDQIYYRNELRQKLNADAIFYVDILNTSPGATGLGTSTNPFGSIMAAVEWAKGFDYNGYSLKLKVADGTYTESIVFDGTEWVGLRSRGKGAAITLEGNLISPVNVTLSISSGTSPEGVRVESPLDVWVRGFRMISTYPATANITRSALLAYNTGVIAYSDIVLGNGFDYHLVGRLGGYFALVGNVSVVGSASGHVIVTNNSTWSLDAEDRRYALFPTGQALPPANITFAANLTMAAIFQAHAGSTIAFDRPHLTFVGSSIVTGRSLFIENDSLAVGGDAVDPNDPAGYSFIPSSLGYLNANNTLRLTQPQSVSGIKTFADNIRVPNASFGLDAVNLNQLSEISNQAVRIFGDQNVAGIKNFSQNIRVPNGTYGLDAVNLNQLLAAIPTASGDRLVFPNGLKIHWGYRGGNNGQSGGAGFNLTFSSAPVVVATAYEANQTVMFAISNVTTTGYTWWGRLVNNNNISGNHFFIAIGF